MKGERPFFREALVSLEEEEMSSRVERAETWRMMANLFFLTGLTRLTGLG